MPRADKNLKCRKSSPCCCKMSKQEREALEAISHAPKFPKKLVGIKKHRKNCC